MPLRVLTKCFEFDSTDAGGMRLVVSVTPPGGYDDLSFARIEIDVAGTTLAAYLGPEDAQALGGVLREWADTIKDTVLDGPRAR